jgi:hypothetical protein
LVVVEPPRLVAVTVNQPRREERSEPPRGDGTGHPLKLIGVATALSVAGVLGGVVAVKVGVKGKVCSNPGEPGTSGAHFH